MKFNNLVYDFVVHFQSSSSSLSLSIFQYQYLDSNFCIRGTWDKDIYEKEKASLKMPYI